jgi:hypothetical protein
LNRATRSTTRDSSPHDDNPVLRHGRREAIVILLLWGATSLFSATYCYTRGYLTHPPDPESTGPSIAAIAGPLTSLNRDPASLTFPLSLGIPDWVFYGILAPWAFSIVATVAFCLFYFQEDDLGDDINDQ